MLEPRAPLPPPFPPTDDPQPIAHLSDGEKKIGAVGAMFVLMYALALVNQLGQGVLTIDPRYAPLIMTAIPPATLAIEYLLGLLKKADPDLPMAKRPAAAPCVGCRQINQEAPCPHDAETPCGCA